MQRSIILALLLDLSVGAFATDCSAGYKHKATLTDLKCTTAKTDAASCNGQCCEADTKTCGGLGATCGANKYTYPAGAKATVVDAWKAKAATSKDMATQCCTDAAKCNTASYTCPAGYKKNSGNAAYIAGTIYCTDDAASCAKKFGASGNTFCCIPNTDTCGSATDAKCGSGGTNVCKCKAATAAGEGTQRGADDAWKNKAHTGTTLASFQAACCSPLPTCESKLYACPAGYKRDDTQKTHVCPGLDPSTCAGTADWSNVMGLAGADDAAVVVGFNNNAAGKCCKVDAKTCQQYAGGACASSRYQISDAGAHVENAADALNVCCTAKASCALAKCPSGYMKKANSDAQLCPKDANSCTEAAQLTSELCCVKDKTKCGGLTGITCAAGFYDESARPEWADKKKYTKAMKDAWNNKPATEATKGTACCTAQAACTNITTAAAAGVTTTPAAVVTTTPAAAALKFSEHKAAIQKDSDRPWAMNMVWLAVGGLMGMSVLMVARGLRSRTASTEVDPREVNGLLDNESVE